MRIIESTAAATLALGLFGCAATLPPPKPWDAESSAIGISVRVRPPIKLFGSNEANVVYFIKLDEEGDVAAQDYFVQSNHLLQSNYADDGQIYLLNAEPGRYAVVAVFHATDAPAAAPSETSGGGVSVTIDLNDPGELKFFTFLSKDVIQLTEVTVAPGVIVFMGDYVIDQSWSLKDADDTQSYYFNLIVPDAKTGFLSKAFSGKDYSKGSLHKRQRDSQAEMNFLIEALQDLEETGWSNLIHRRMEELKTVSSVSRERVVSKN